MKKLITLIIYSFCICAYLENIPVTLQQPDNTSFNCFATGDEFYARLHDVNGYTIIQNQKDGYYYYAQIINGSLTTSIYKVHEYNPLETELESGILISREQYLKQRGNFNGSRTVRDAPTVGTINNINIFIRFSDESEFSTPRSFYDEPFNDPNGPSIIHYYQEVSYDNLEINTTHYPVCDMNTNLSYQDSHPRSYYQIYNAITNPNGYFECPAWNENPSYNCDSIDSTLWSSYREQTLLKNAVEFIQAEVSQDLDEDADEDGYVDNVTFLVSGPPDGWAELLWPHRSSLYLYDVYINDAIVDGYNVNLATGGYFTASVLCHEFGHSLGAPDLYRYFDVGGDVPIVPIGQWDIMGWNTSNPQYPSAWIKYRYFNWIDCPMIQSSGNYELNPSSLPDNNCFQIRSPYSDTQHFVVEYRKQEGMYDSNLPGNSDGMLIFRVNLDINENGVIDTLDSYGEGELLEGWTVGGNGLGPPDELYVYRQNGTSNDNGVGTAAIFSSLTGRTEINDTSNPSSFLHGGVSGGLDISDIGLPGETINFFCNIACSNNITGDINYDEIVDILDIILTVNFIINSGYDSCSDINGDGVVNIQDIILIINIILS